MTLVAYDPIHHLDACLNETLRKVNVVRFIKSARSSTTAVTSLLLRAASTNASMSDDFDPTLYKVILMASTLGSSTPPSHFNDWIKRAIWMMEQKIFFTDDRQNVSLIVQFIWNTWRKWSKL